MKKGFTLIELLSVIIILAIILVIAVPQILKVMETSRDNAYKNQEQLLTKAAKVFVSSNSQILPTEIGDSVIVELSEMQNNNLIGEIKDKKQQSIVCDGYVLIRFIESLKYDYIPYLKCEDNYMSKSIIKDGLVLDMPLGDHISGNLYLDRSGFDRNGTNYGSSFIQNRFDENDKASSFDGISNYVNVGNVGTFDEYSFSVWINPNDIIGSGENASFGFTIAATSSLYGLWLLQTQGEIKFFAFSGSTSIFGITSGVGIEAGNWYNISVTAKRNGTAKIYVNGEEKLSFNASSHAWGGNLTIADLRPGREIFYNGKMSDIRLYNRILSHGEIRHNYEIEKNKSI